MCKESVTFAKSEFLHKPYLNFSLSDVQAKHRCRTYIYHTYKTCNQNIYIKGA